MNQYQMAVGMYQTACEGSPNRQQINLWLNEGKSNIWISRELEKQFAEKISDKSVGKYRKYYDERVQKELEKTPEYQSKVQAMNDELSMSIGKLKSVDILGKLSDLIENSADMLADAKDRDVQIESAQDMRYVSQTMLDAIKLYGDTVLKAQKAEEIGKNPDLLRPTTINFNIRSALTDILRGVISEDGNKEESNFDVIDKLRYAKFGTSSNVFDPGGFSGDTVESGSSIMDGE